jgi:hypothetical protein
MNQKTEAQIDEKELALVAAYWVEKPVSLRRKFNGTTSVGTALKSIIPDLVNNVYDHYGKTRPESQDGYAKIVNQMRFPIEGSKSSSHALQYMCLTDPYIAHDDALLSSIPPREDSGHCLDVIILPRNTSPMMETLQHLSSVRSLNSRLMEQIQVQKAQQPPPGSE